MAGNVRMEYSQEQLLQMAAKGQVTIAGCYAGSELLGWAMADDRGRILMVYVAEAHRNGADRHAVPGLQPEIFCSSNNGGGRPRDDRLL